MLVYNAAVVATSLCEVYMRLTSLRGTFGLARTGVGYSNERNMT